MLYPNFKELLSYEAGAKGVGLNLKKKYSGDISGNFLSSFRGQGMEFDEVREYVYGDDVRDIEWRVSARSEKTHVKVYREERKRNVVIAVDNNDYMYFGTRNTFKSVQSARIAAILGFAANRNNDKVGLYIYGNQKNRFTYFKPVNSKNSLFHGLKNLCEEKGRFDNYSLSGAIFNLKRIGANPNILFIISDFRYADEYTEKNIFLLGKRPEIVFINLVDDADYLIPDIGKLIIEYDDRRLMIDTSNRRAVEKYRRLFAEKQNNIRKTVARLNAKLININTKDDVLKELLIGLR
jgi:uncharacterized protein (DUF58 family)